MRVILPYLFLLAVCYATIDDYKAERAKIVRDEALLSVGGNSTLTDKESDVNNCLMQRKFREVDYGFNNPQKFKLSRHFFSYKDDIRTSRVYKIIKDLPKGAALHIHDMGILGPDYILNLTYTDHLYICFKKDDVLFRFSDNTPSIPCKNKWKLISDARRSSNNTASFDAKLRKYFTMYVDNPDVVYPSIKESWGSFVKYFERVVSLLTYRPIWEQYCYEVLRKFREDNIMYVEFRSVLPNLYELDGTVYDPIVTAKCYKKIFNQFKKDHPDFLGAKLIYAPIRGINRDQLDEYLRLARAIKADMPDVFAGFDLVGQEDLGSPLIEFIPQLLAASKDLDYFFHAGETDWYGTSTDENLIDAILLGAKRLGHAYALPKHPLLMKEVIERDIGVEVNLISNNVLSLVRDVRNHPLSGFLASGMPVVLSSDDPGIWEADPLSDDFYVAFVGVASRLSDLRLLKHLAFNSIKYSSLKGSAKVNAIVKFTERWDTFIENFDCSKY
ncbi:adenosine deaminase AGSA-like [Maniola hyperantus]|uniref:adenosine deaminase AGSA-like n=1 Tax=Aphantopus hyperantus TaxID=2795564 RepID=UPI0015696D3A|nr:adenosine deaminase AGSA-like [Maniola hyperantus]